MFDSTHSGMTRSSIHDNDFLELLWENGQVIASNREHKTPDSFKSYSTSPPHKETGINHEDVRITKRTRLSTLYSLYDQFPSPKDSDTDMSYSHQRNGQDSSHSSQIKNSFKDKEQIVNLLRSDKDSKQVTTCNNNNHLCTDSSQLSPPPKKQRTVSNYQPTPATDSHHFECHQRERKANFSNFSIPTVFLKSTSYHGKSATKPPRNAILDEIEARKVEKAEAAEAAKGSDIGLKRLQNQTPCVQKNTELAPHDEHSEAVGNGIHRSYGNQGPNSQALRTKGKANNRNQCNEQFLASSSVCSLGTSNDPNFGTRRHEDTDESTYLSDNDGEAEDVVKETSDREECSRVKRSRNPEVHNLSEKKRREKINKKMRALKELIPNCNKVDKASMLDDAIDYLKALKLQLQIMTVGNGLLMNMMHYMNGAQLIGLRPTQFPIPPPPLSAITDNRLHHQMFGLNNQMPQIPIPHHPPFFPIIPNSNFTKPHLMATTTNHIPNSAPLQVSLPLNSSHVHAKAENVAMQVPNQVSLHQHSATPPAVPFIFPQ